MVDGMTNAITKAITKAMTKAITNGVTKRKAKQMTMAILGYTSPMKRISLKRINLKHLSLNPVHIAIIILSISLLLVSPVSMASKDHLEARQLQASGNILPLQQLIDIIREHQPGTVIELELEYKHKRVIYEVEILGDDGHVTKLLIDAQTGEILSTKEDD